MSTTDKKYVPSHDLVRQSYIATIAERPSEEAEVGEEFDRWIAEHDAAVRRHAAQQVRDYWDACHELIDSNNGARLAFEAVAQKVEEVTR